MEQRARCLRARVCWGRWTTWLSFLVLLAGHTGASVAAGRTDHPSEVTALTATDSLPAKVYATSKLDSPPTLRLLGWRRILTDSAPSLFVDNKQSTKKRALFWSLTFFFSMTPFICACYGLCSVLCCKRHRRRQLALRQQREAVLAAEAATQTTPPETVVTVRFSDLELGTFEDLTGLPRLNDECPICLREFGDDEKVRQLPACRHSFHPECIAEWVAKHNTCPLCRTLLLPPLPPEGPADARTHPERPSSAV
ncbi:Zinc finger RING-type domain containing protein [Klebsormidium nitens]|uniref:Zinc finger RING-type domain containing protein n=1 Tax=Klebsormidium nitens TaxID=105231 RepID=A0A1Y1HUU9_KLENI|nr:Zinc finger RING-type domain containing protein [Klebsormidium nitens]|eukprot:GAQ79628.1 Zinc finger RING-type domain containing protein [Klebsormidium nitens]